MMRHAGLAGAWLLGLLSSAMAYPVSVESCGETLTFSAAPRRAVVHDLNMTEMVLALGLRERLVGVTGISGWYKTGPEFKAALGNVPELAPKYPSMETLLAVAPDFFFAGWYYGMNPGGEVTPATLARQGVATLVLSESCIHLGKPRPTATMDLLYADMLKLGAIFDRSAQAAALVAQWKQRLAAVQLPQATQRLRVFLYDSGEDKPFTAGRHAIAHAMIDAAGGHNVMADLETSWAHAAWETVAARNPQFLILLDYQDGVGPERLLRNLQTHPAMRNTDAVRQRRFVALRYAELTPGPANIAAIEKLAAALRLAAQAAAPVGK
ncbi:MAG: ABC transporter substrate-binding protein [Burkholderiaceae bacterium]